MKGQYKCSKCKTSYVEFLNAKGVVQYKCKCNQINYFGYDTVAEKARGFRGADFISKGNGRFVHLCTCGNQVAKSNGVTKFKATCHKCGKVTVFEKGLVAEKKVGSGYSRRPQKHIRKSFNKQQNV